jgi:PIN domain nuclease of toxin-antitoxin system
MLGQNIKALTVEHVHALRVAQLPLHHNDPFDHLLVAQAQVENLSLMTADPILKKYKVNLIWAGRRSPKSKPNR